MAPQKKKQATGSQEPKPKDRCFWTPDDETALIDFVEVNKARAGDGMNFDKTFWNDVAAHLAGSTSQGAVKTGDACLSKWNHLCATFVIVDRASIISLASTSAAVAGMSFDEVEMHDNEVALDELENTSNDETVIDVLMPPPPSLFDTALQSPFAPSTLAIVFQERTPHAINPIPLRRQKAIIQLEKEEGLEDHQVVAVIKHFQKDVAIIDSYLAIEKDSICRLFLSDYFN
ncbi:hypothetical protein DEU56DRAFT_915619 [Suillus clintonianus]|uniref:uncharacterized protein n=1 Tax=Suillus clintonianus TaxID=1904413 RepID=UPI001B865685|nr:uncharacterized protein DEU56DRAFT_915619 [Suillus clintonianus]KAG2128015.1 hypothetical protein DEU56DRAFT_915619 [Suillus clintonianus]